MSNNLETEAQACDQCYRTKQGCSKTLPQCQRCLVSLSPCTYSFGKFMGKPKRSAKNRQQNHSNPRDVAQLTAATESRPGLSDTLGKDLPETQSPRNTKIVGSPAPNQWISTPPYFAQEGSVFEASATPNPAPPPRPRPQNTLNGNGKRPLAAPACDQCYRFKVKCTREPDCCQRCVNNGSVCTYSAAALENEELDQRRAPEEENRRKRPRYFTRDEIAMDAEGFEMTSADSQRLPGTACLQPPLEEPFLDEGEEFSSFEVLPQQITTGAKGFEITRIGSQRLSTTACPAGPPDELFLDEGAELFNLEDLPLQIPDLFPPSGQDGSKSTVGFFAGNLTPESHCEIDSIPSEGTCDKYPHHWPNTAIGQDANPERREAMNRRIEKTDKRTPKQLPTPREPFPEHSDVPGTCNCVSRAIKTLKALNSCFQHHTHASSTRRNALIPDGQSGILGAACNAVRVCEVGTRCDMSHSSIMPMLYAIILHHVSICYHILSSGIGDELPNLSIKSGSAQFCQLGIGRRKKAWIAILKSEKLRAEGVCHELLERFADKSRDRTQGEKRYFGGSNGLTGLLTHLSGRFKEPLRILGAS